MCRVAKALSEGARANRNPPLFAQFGATDAARSTATAEGGIDGNAAVDGLPRAGEDAVQRIGAIGRQGGTWRHA